MSQQQKQVLIVDDDEGVRYTIAGILEDHDAEVIQASGGEEALAILDGDPADMPGLVITDLRMPGMSGLELIDAITARPDPPKVVLTTAPGSERMAVDAVKRGAYDYFRKPFEMDELMAVVDRALESVRLRAENERLQGEVALGRTMVFASAPMRRLAVLVRRVAPRDVTVLIRGESGTGKELVARALHDYGKRRGGPFVAVNMAAIPRELIESELFGHEKGAFTGAAAQRQGRSEQADRGPLFPDEIRDMPAATQTRPLRVLAAGAFSRGGGHAPTQAPGPTIAATHPNQAQPLAHSRIITGRRCPKTHNINIQRRIQRQQSPMLRQTPLCQNVARKLLRGLVERISFFGKSSL